MAGVSSHNAMAEDTTTRQWNFHAFEWVVRDVGRLRDHIENTPLDTPEGDVAEGPVDEMEDDDFEVLRESPELADGKFKLEISKTTLNDPEGSSAPSTPIIRTQPPTLSLFITSLTIDYAHTDYGMAASMFAAIKCQDDRVGERGARAEWAWEYWQNNWVFRQGSEVWECPIPPLSMLLENPRVKETDSFVICVQMHSPVGPFFPQQPSAYYVPRDLLEGLEASLDNPNTGDVQFVCLERTAQQEHDSSTATAPDSPLSSASSQTSTPTHTQMIARKRTIYAHSDILIRRSEYFATMLSSSFAENCSTLLPGERKLYTVVVEEADFVTIYWLLKWVYANWVLFRKDDDPRQAVDGIGAGWNAREFTSPGVVDEWEWKVFHKSGSSEHSGGVSDSRSVTSGASGRSTGEAQHEKPKAGPSTTSAMRSTSGTKGQSPSSTRPPTTPRRLSHGPTSGNAVGLTIPMPNTTSPTRSRGSKPVPVPLSPSAAHYPHSAHKQRTRGSISSADPHPHPAPPPLPASALSMYQVAHRYAMPGLGALALEHIVSTITPQSSFAVLLASSTWDELHSLVEDYVIEKWEEVSVSNEFEQCCQEVASGEWGPEGGKTLMALFRRLRSPSAMGYVRN
ncbi:hypothetical protein C8Q80DRAFT_1217862 [Daedaleopsis nitida]|nr:hypothetical protein C8Q80DRAFT_1217862 [Daedaleopsis nitida]